jgi:hypothetical protein
VPEFPLRHGPSKQSQGVGEEVAVATLSHRSRM